MTLGFVASHAVSNPRAPITVVETDYNRGYKIWLKNTGANPVYIGGANVTVANGWLIPAGETLLNGEFLSMGKGQNIYAIATIDIDLVTVLTSTLQVILVGV